MRKVDRKRVEVKGGGATTFATGPFPFDCTLWSREGEVNSIFRERVDREFSCGNLHEGNEFGCGFGTRDSANGKVKDTRNGRVTFVTGLMSKHATV